MGSRMFMGTRWTTFVCLALWMSGTKALAADALSELVAAGAKLETLWKDGRFTEGPAASRDGRLLFSDIPNERIVEWLGDGSSKVYLESSGRANGLMFDGRGVLYACQGGARRVVQIDTTKEKVEVQPVAILYDGKKLNSPNDLALDTHGGLYFTDPRYGRGEPLEQPCKGVYYVSAAGDVRRVIEDLELPNGILVSPDGKHLYVAENAKGEIYRYAIEGAGKIGKGAVFYRGDPELDGKRGPDGMAHDARGNLYATYRAVTVISPGAEVLGRIEVPLRPANCTFGGKDRKTLYITARSSLFSIQMQVEGAPLRDKGPGGSKKEATRPVKLRELTLDAPESWKATTPRSSVRLGQFEIAAHGKDKEGAELVVFLFGGNTGGVEANVERWIGQFDADGLRGEQESGASREGDFVFVDLVGTYQRPVGPPVLRRSQPTPGWRVINGIVKKGNDFYFLKLSGPKATVGRHAAALRTAIGVRGKTKREKIPRGKSQ